MSRPRRTTETLLPPSTLSRGRLGSIGVPLLLVGSGALLLAACGSSPSSSPTSTSSSVTTTTSTATTTTNSPSGASSTTVPSATTSSRPGASLPTNGGVESCATSALRVTLGPGNGTAGSIYYSVVFTNIGKTRCVMYGYPGVSAVTGSAGTEVGPPADERALTGSLRVVTLVPRRKAGTVLRVVDALNYPKSLCRPTAVRGVRIYPPNEQAAVFISLPHLQVCSAKNISVLSIGPVVPARYTGR
ncbi:MAG: hypothetical protein JWM85_3407 [Acidimicrobiaceae bacterium]|nr:hypothetical protein [Acidimicrobiaceae bacterium]